MIWERDEEHEGPGTVSGSEPPRCLFSGMQVRDSGVVDGDSEAFFGAFPYQRELQWHVTEMCQQRGKK